MFMEYNNSKNTAVNGSNAPRMAVFVEPISLIAIFIVSIEIIVGSKAKPKEYPHKIGLFSICNCVQNFKLIM